MKENFKISLGKSFPSATIFLGYFLALFGILALASNFILAFILIILGLFFSFSKEEIEFNLRQKKYRRVTNLLGMKSGKWLDLSSLPYLSILKNNVANKLTSRTLVSTTNKETFYEVHLLSPSHRKKVLIQRFETLEEAKEKAKVLAVKLEKEIVAFSPKPSERTRQRRKR